ncbi:MAG: TlpA disulfide reductase family protein [bacterium]|nr:TlpA disulfide reductase family protein [bacterium]
MKRNVFLILVFAVLFAAAACSPSPKAGSEQETSSSNIYLEKTWMEGLNGETLSLKDMEGSVVVIDFWATWCGPCRASIPLYVKLYETYSSQGLKVIGVNVNETKEEIEAFVQKEKINYAMARFNNDLNSIYKVSGIPSVFIFDKKGNKVANFTGYSSELDAKIEEIIRLELAK